MDACPQTESRTDTISYTEFLTDPAVTPGSRIRVRSELLDTEKFSEDTANLFLRHTVEVDGHAKPAAVVETITRCIF